MGKPRHTRGTEIQRIHTMIVFLVVGTLFPFDRLVREIDRWAGMNKDIRVIAQVGHSKYKAENIETHAIMKAAEFNTIFEESDLIIAHAGMGIILKSLVANKPIIVFPRKHEFKEHTTDHQMDTARAFQELEYIQVAWDIADLQKYLEEPKKIKSKKIIGPYASESLIEALRDFIEQN